MQPIIDKQTIRLTDHACDGCSGGQKCCCAVFDICINHAEMKTIIGALPLAAEFRPELSENGNVFDEEEPGLFSIDKDDNGDCVFSYRSGGKMLCALHSAALKAGLPPHNLKPTSCTLWPLSLSEPPDAMLSICDDAYDFHCVNRCKKQAEAFAPALAASIKAIFGPEAQNASGG